jgi:hypothetical protein
MDTILRSEVMKLVDTGDPFTMEFVTADRRRGTGGKLIEVINWVKKVGQPVEDTIPGKHIRRKASEVKKDPDHWRHGTFNIENPGNKALHLHKVHVPLMQTFNGKKIVNG